MAGKIRIDLHTHAVSALREKLGISGIRDIKKEAAQLIVKAMKDSGLEGIAITEHNNFNWGLVASLEIEENFPRENLIILPGTEIEFQNQHYLRIYVPERIRRRFSFFEGREWFTVLAHPGYYHPLEIAQLTSVQIDCVEGESEKGKFDIAGQIAQEKAVPVIQSSDAHRLENLGFRAIELEAAARHSHRNR
jgi:histidinol phosphatase-like PHP family hydrolase